MSKSADIQHTLSRVAPAHRLGACIITSPTKLDSITLFL